MRRLPIYSPSCKLATRPSLWPSPPAEGPRRSSRGVSRRPFVPDDFTGILVTFQGRSSCQGPRVVGGGGLPGSKTAAGPAAGPAFLAGRSWGVALGGGDLPGPKAAVGPAFSAGFVPEVFTGILVLFQGLSRLVDAAMDQVLVVFGC